MNIQIAVTLSVPSKGATLDNFYWGLYTIRKHLEKKNCGWELSEDFWIGDV